MSFSPEDAIPLRIKYKEMTSLQLNEELRQVLNFIPNVAEGAIDGTNIIVNSQNVEKRLDKSVISPILSAKLITLLEFMDSTPKLKEEIVDFFSVSYFVAFGLSIEHRRYYELLMEENIFEREGTEKTERKWHEVNLTIVNRLISYFEPEERESQKWRLERMKEWGSEIDRHYGKKA